MALFVVKVNVTFGENVPLLYEIKLLATNRVKRVDDLKAPLFFTRIGCNREGI
jgi:hypothetical protein